MTTHTLSFILATADITGWRLAIFHRLAQYYKRCHARQSQSGVVGRCSIAIYRLGLSNALSNSSHLNVLPSANIVILCPDSTRVASAGPTQLVRLTRQWGFRFQPAPSRNISARPSLAVRCACYWHTFTFHLFRRAYLQTRERYYNILFCQRI